MSRKIILTAKNYNSSTGTFTYVFPFTQDFGEDDTLAITQFNMFNSFYNISKTIGNNKIYIGVPNADGSTYTQLTGTIPDGFYDTASFNIYLQSLMYDNNLYFKSNGVVTYYLSLDLLATEYKNQITLYKLSGVTLQSGTTYSSIKDIYFNVSFSSGLGELFGFSSNVTYGPTSSPSITSLTTKITKSNLTPQINPFNSIIVVCDLVQQVGLCDPINYLFSCALNVDYGSMIEPKKLENVYMKCKIGSAKSITLTILDNGFNLLKILDNNTMIVLTFKKNEKIKK